MNSEQAMHAVVVTQQDLSTARALGAPPQIIAMHARWAESAFRAYTDPFGVKGR